MLVDILDVSWLKLDDLSELWYVIVKNYIIQYKGKIIQNSGMVLTIWRIALAGDSVRCV